MNNYSMNTNTFNRLVQDQFKVCKEILAKNYELIENNSKDLAL